jgi:hypothetical protein
MAILRIQHSVLSYEGWKQMFDADPADRKGLGCVTSRSTVESQTQTS